MSMEVHFKMSIEGAGAAFQDFPEDEVVRMLRDVAQKVESGRVYGDLRDFNGNWAGEWELDAADDGED